MTRRALLVIDIQTRYTQPGPPFDIPGIEILIAGINELAGVARSAGDPVVWISRLVRPRVGPGRRTTSRYGQAASATFVGFNAELDDRLQIEDEDILLTKPRLRVRSSTATWTRACGTST